eukprot:365227-Chlamydomonas_euryale.AAC.4
MSAKREGPGGGRRGGCWCEGRALVGGVAVREARRRLRWWWRWSWHGWRWQGGGIAGIDEHEREASWMVEDAHRWLDRWRTGGWIGGVVRRHVTCHLTRPASESLHGAEKQHAPRWERERCRVMPSKRAKRLVQDA